MHISKEQEIDFLSIDVEGHDYDVLKSLNFDKYSPRVILVELLGSKISNISEDVIYAFLKKRNYFLNAKTINTAILIHEDF